MQLHLKRSQNSSGMLSKSVTFVLDARVTLSEEEKQHIAKYKLGSEVLYASEKAKQQHETIRSAGGFRAIAAAAMSHLSLHITIDSLMKGQTIQGKSLDEIMGAEAAVREGCENMKAYIAVAAMFNGQEEVVEY